MAKVQHTSRIKLFLYVSVFLNLIFGGIIATALFTNYFDYLMFSKATPFICEYTATIDLEKKGTQFRELLCENQ